MAFKRYRSSSGRYIPRPPVRMPMAQRYRRSGMLGKTTALASRVHVFRRLGNLFTIQGNGAALPLVNGVLGGSLSTGLALGSITPGAVTGSNSFGGSMNFQLSNIATPSELVNLFDNYRIKAVKLRFDFSCNSAPVGDAVTNLNLSLPLMHYCIDNDDDVTPTTVTNVLENGYSKSAKLDRTFYVTIKPRLEAVVKNAAGGLQSGGMATANQWLDTGASTIKHFGFKFWMTDIWQSGMTGSQSGWALTITPTYILELKNVI